MTDLRQILLVAVVSSTPLLAQAGESDGVAASGRSFSRILLTETAPSEVLFSDGNTAADYGGGEEAANRMLGFVSEYGGWESPRPERLDPHADLLSLFAERFERELHEDPFYLFGKEVDRDIFPYEEQAWNAAGSALRRKYTIVRAADQLLRRVQEATTVSYEAKSGMTFKVRPAIEDITDSEKIRVRMAFLRPGIVDRVEARVGSQDLKITFAKMLILRGKVILGQAIYERREQAESEEADEHLGELTLSIPFW